LSQQTLLLLLLFLQQAALESFSGAFINFFPLSHSLARSLICRQTFL